MDSYSSLYSTLDDLAGNIAFLSGGAIYGNRVNTINLNGSIIQNNSALNGGGLAVSWNAYIYVNECLFSHNRGGYEGGAINLIDTVIDIQNSKFLSNKALSGGGIFLSHSNSTITNSNFSINAAESGGALYLFGSSAVNITDAYFTSNFAFLGGAMFGDNSNIFLKSSYFSKNSASGAYADVSSRIAELEIDYVLSSIYGLGGAFYVYLTRVVYTGCHFTENVADIGGVFYLEYANVESPYSKKGMLSSFIRNSATFEGGGFAVVNPSLVDLFMNVFQSNQAATLGRAIYAINFGTITLRNCSVEKEDKTSVIICNTKHLLL